jgi:hypothetical protein
MDRWSAVKRTWVAGVGMVLIASQIPEVYPGYHCLIETPTCHERPVHLHDPSRGATAPNTLSPEYVMSVQYTRGAAIATAPSTPSWPRFAR